MTWSSLRRWLEQPISERDRQRAFALAAVALVLAAAVLTLTARPTDQTPAPVARTTPAAVAPAAVPTPTPSVAPRAPGPARAPRRAGRVARRFLAGYLPYLYGQRPASRIVATTRSLRRELASNRPRVSPAARRRRPRIVALKSERVPERRAWVVTARIADGGVAVYPIELVIDRRPGGSVVVQIGGE